MPESFAPTNSLTSALDSGGLALVLSIQAFASVNIARIAKATGYDAIYVDLQHGGHTQRETTEICAAAVNVGIAALVRVPSVSEQVIVPLLDGGALGIIAPGVRDADEARELIRLCRFPPLGERSAPAHSPQLGFAKTSKTAAAETLEKLTTVVAMIESPEGVENCDEIASVPGLDVLLVGSNDLTGALGIPGKYTDPRVIAAYEKLAAACDRHGKVLGIGGIKDDAETLRRYIGLGGRLITAGSEVRYLIEIVGAKAASLRSLSDAVPKQR